MAIDGNQLSSVNDLKEQIQALDDLREKIHTLETERNRLKNEIEYLRQTDEEQDVKLERIIEIMCDDANTWFSSKIRFFLRQFQRREPSDDGQQKNQTGQQSTPPNEKLTENSNVHYNLCKFCAFARFAFFDTFP